MMRDPTNIVRGQLRGRGVGLVTAIFLLVVLAALGVAMVSVFTTQQATVALDEQGARAYQAARAGIEWGIYRQQQAPVGSACPFEQTITLPQGGTLASFYVTVSCKRIDTPGIALPRWLITSIACNQSGTCATPSNSPDYVARRLEVEL